LSALSGVLIPLWGLEQGAGGVAVLLSILAGLYYAVGFLSNGEGAAYFWFDKLTDYDEDNTKQVWIAGSMLALSVVTIVVTSSASGAFIAYFMGVFADFDSIPSWVQSWVVWMIPVFWVVNFSAGTLFKALSDESANERKVNSEIRAITQNIEREKGEARKRYWQENAPDLARQLGELEAQEEIRKYSAKLGERNGPN
jgi:hypothetical protein